MAELIVGSQLIGRQVGCGLEDIAVSALGILGSLAAARLDGPSMPWS